MRSHLVSVKNPQGSHQSCEHPGQGGGSLHEDVHAGVVHVPADGLGGRLQRLEVSLRHVLHLRDQALGLSRRRRARRHVARDVA